MGCVHAHLMVDGNKSLKRKTGKLDYRREGLEESC